MNKLNLLAIAILTMLFFSCTSINQIGIVTMISTRNIDSKTEYTLIRSYAADSKSALRDLKGKTIEEAINNTVKSVPGGEFLKNVKIYKVGSHNYAVQGDVWGNSGEISYRGFKQGDKVTWKEGLISKVYVTGIIQSLENDKNCLVKRDDNGIIVEKSYDDVSKAQ